MNYAIIANDTITAHGSAKVLWPDTSFSDTGPTADFLADANAFPIRSDLPHNPETQYLRRVEPYLLDRVAWDREAVAKPPAPPVPNWIGYQAAISMSPTVGALLATCLSPEVAPVGGAQIYGGMIVGLGQVATGGSMATFLTAWELAKASGLVSVDLIAEMMTLAEPFNLPAEFVSALDGPP